VRVWVEGAPGGDETRVVHGTITEIGDDGALIELDEPARAGDRDLQRFLARPRERGWGLDALWFSFIAVDVRDPEEAAPAESSPPEGSVAVSEAAGAPLARWYLRLR
jgi:hypothetical protein